MSALSERVLDALRAGAVVVTSTSRLRDEIRRNYAHHQADKGVQAWQRGNVVSWSDWLRSLGEQVLWSGYTSPAGRRRLLLPLHEQLLWERILTEEPVFDLPLNVRSTAKMAREAWQLLQDWRLPDPGTVGFTSVEQGAFSAWMKRYFAACTEHSWLDSARVIDSLVPAISSGAVPVPGHVLLIGFDSFNPQQRGLLRVLTGMGTRLGMSRPDSRENRAGLLTLPDGHSELQTAVRWLRGLVAADSGCQIGLVVPNLANCFQKVERLLDAALLPGSSLPGAGSEAALPYQLGAGRPLRKQPVVVAADHVLALSMGSVSMRVLSRVIRSPFIAGGITEAAWRARFDAWMRDKGSVDIDVQHLPGMFEAFRHYAGISTDEFKLEPQIDKLLAHNDDHGPRPAGVWARNFTDLLELFGWPGEGRQDAIQRQAQQDFESLLREFASLDAVLGDMTSAEALRVLRHLLRARHFEFHTHNVPISVLDPVDAEWLSFDSLWICDAGSAGWTEAIGAPNPFIPIEWQRNQKLPQSSPALRTERANQLATRLMGAAPQVVVSNAQDSDRGFMLGAYSSLPELPLQEIELAELTDYRQALLGADQIEAIDDYQAPVLDPVESIDLNQSVLALQSACPFRSFAQQRLGAIPLRALRPGVRPEARVDLVRMALEHMWHRIESSEVLQAALIGEHLEVQIWEVADTVLAVFERKLPVRLSKRYRALEHARLVRLLLNWLRVETHRASFEVRQTNVYSTIEIGGVTMRAHVDRVDEVEGKGLAIIDYDTNRFESQRWVGDRPDSPSLLLYALATEEEPLALLTGCVAADGMDLAGVQHDTVVSGLPVYEDSGLAELTGLSWDQLLASWREVLENLTLQFAGGDARVLPKHGPATCHDCHLGSLCRVSERDRVLG
ncbi:MAG: PD-(D/E)XK nuclease family protein [Gammaproteobacteria bacterium]|nr:PD-(D/E)XK nuclease family protein [Gammaproteobacteria bacterium]